MSWPAVGTYVELDKSISILGVKAVLIKTTASLFLVERTRNFEFRAEETKDVSLNIPYNSTFIITLRYYETQQYSICYYNIINVILKLMNVPDLRGLIYSRFKFHWSLTYSINLVLSLRLCVMGVHPRNLVNIVVLSHCTH
jgi:hypothetical protein